MFCGKSHYCDKCENIIDIAIRKKILREEKRCFKCVLNDHVIKHCRSNYRCFNCQGKNHHTAICNRLKFIKSDAKETKNVTANDDNKNDENFSMVADAKIDVLLQIDDCIMLNPSETKSLKVKVLLDPGLHKTYLSDNVRDLLQLDTINKENVQIKAFGDTKGQLKELDEFKFVLRDWNSDGLRIYLACFSVLVVCGLVNGQKVKFAKSNYSFFKNVKLADEGLYKENIDLLIGADFYWDIVDGSVKKGNGVAPVALRSKLG